MTTTTKTVDGKGRIVLGSEFANQLVQVTRDKMGRIIVTPVVAIPEHEAWLYRNKSAITSLRQGLAQAESGKFSDSSPDLDADAELADEFED